MKLLNIRVLFFGARLAFIVSLFLSCRKQQDDYLSVKANNSDVTPTTLADFQALLDNDAVMNRNYVMAGLASTDNFYSPDAKFPSLSPATQQLYLWAADIWQGEESSDWNYAYTMIEYGNVALDGIQKISVNIANQSDYNNIKGSALFYRAIGFYNLASVFCKPYMAGTASTDLGIPLRLTSDVNVKSVRASVQQTYDQIINDLKLAATLLPATPFKINRPSSTAAYALLAKVYFSMEDYTNALDYANKTLLQKNDLMDFNNTSLVNATARKPFLTNPTDNPEIIFYADGLSYLSVNPLASRANVDSSLYDSYSTNDIRHTAFFYSNGDGTYRFKGTYDMFYSGDFCGLATNEIYLIRAECYARTGNTSSSLSDLNLLLGKRFITNTFTPLNTNNTDTALVWVLKERRKELPFTSNIRWEDLRRLNKDPRFAITLRRIVTGVSYTLPPNDSRYVLPIPDKEIQLTGMQQNPRN